MFCSRGTPPREVYQKEGKGCLVEKQLGFLSRVPLHHSDALSKLLEREIERARERERE